MNTRNRTSSGYVDYGLYYFFRFVILLAIFLLGLSISILMNFISYCYIESTTSISVSYYKRMENGKTPQNGDLVC
jgi:hypothetical protein